MRFFQKHQKKILAALALLMALLLILPMITMIIGNAGAVTQEEIDKLKEDAESLIAEKEELNNQLAALEGEIDSAYSRKLIVEKEIMVVEEQIANTQAMIDEYEELISQEEEKLVQAQEDEARHFQEFCRRVRAMEEEGTVSYWNIIFNAADFTDLLDKAMMISEVVEYDNAVMRALEEARHDIEQSKAMLEQARAEQVSAKVTLEGQKAELDSKRATIEGLLKEMQNKQDIYESKIEHLNEKNEEIEKEIEKKQEELEKQLAAGQIQVNTGSGYVWPLDGYYTLTSLYGNRIHPLTGRPNNHLGIDVRADYGTPIKAARGGVVLISEYHWSYGNYVVVSHYNGDSTLYAHMSSRGVSAGQTVSQGQVVGYVGSTGSSTGNHLHYEVKIGGGRVDPVDMYPKLNLWVIHNGEIAVLPH